MNVKCVSTKCYVFPPGGGNYSSDLMYYFTIGHVYEVLETNSTHYYLLHDHGDSKSWCPTYMFVPTNDPVTPNPNRQKEVKENLSQYLKDKEEQALRDIANSLDEYYAPKKAIKRREHMEKTLKIIQDTFVQGIPYSNY